MRVTLELFARDERIEGCLHAPQRQPVDFTGVLGLLHVLEELNLEPPPVANENPASPQRQGEFT